jgi:hypothetical protein
MRFNFRKAGFRNASFIFSFQKREERTEMKSRFAFEKMTLLVLTLYLMSVFSACGGGTAVKSDQVAKDPGFIEAKEVKPSPQSAQNETPTEKARDGRFIAYDNGTVLDTRTGLMWAAKDNGSEIIWPSAKSYCTNYRGGGYTDWRMPSQDELVGLYDESKTYSVGVSVHLTELIRLSSYMVFTSETRGDEAVSVNFRIGGVSWGPWDTAGYTNRYRALPVRSAK